MPDREGRLRPEEFVAEGRKLTRDYVLRDDLVVEVRAERDDEIQAKAHFQQAPVDVKERLKAEMRRRLDATGQRVASVRAEIGDWLGAHGERLFSKARWADLIFRDVTVEWWRRGRFANPTPPTEVEQGGIA